MGAVHLEPTSVFGPDDSRWELDPATCPLAGSAWYQALPAVVRAHLGRSLRAVGLQAALERSAMAQSATYAVARSLADDPDRIQDVLAVLEAERRRMSSLGRLLAQLGDASIGPAPCDETTRRLARVARWSPELALVLATVLPDPLEELWHLDARGGRWRAGMQGLADALEAPAPAHLAVLDGALRRRSALTRTALGLALPLVLAFVLRRVQPLPPAIVVAYAVPSDVVAQLGRLAPPFRRAMRDALANALLVCEELHILTAPARPLWRLFGCLACLPTS